MKETIITAHEKKIKKPQKRENQTHLDFIEEQRSSFHDEITFEIALLLAEYHEDTNGNQALTVEEITEHFEPRVTQITIRNKLRFVQQELLKLGIQTVIDTTNRKYKYKIA